MILLKFTLLTLCAWIVYARPNQNIDNNLRIKIIRLHSSEELNEYVSEEQRSSCGYSVSLNSVIKYYFIFREFIHIYDI